MPLQVAIEPTISRPVVHEAAARHIAHQYIHAQLGPQYHLNPGSFAEHSLRSTWRFLIIDDEHNGATGYVDIDAKTGEVIPLDSEKLQDMRERAVVLAAKKHKEVARGADGYILPFLAKIRVNGYLSSQVAFFASANGRPTLLPGDPPLWRVTTVLRLRGYDAVIDLGHVDVNAETGAVMPLTNEQIQAMQKRAEDAAALVKCSAAAAR